MPLGGAHAGHGFEVQPAAVTEYLRARTAFTRELCSWTRFSLAEILVVAGTAGAGGMAPPTSTRISARMKGFQGHSSPVNIHTTRGKARCSVYIQDGIATDYIAAVDAKG